MVRRLFLSLLGLILLGVVFYLGFAAAAHQRFIIIAFGLASAILAPAGIMLIARAITGTERRLIKRLSKVPEVERLIQKAQTKEEKIRALEQERSNLLEIIESEAKARFLNKRIEKLEQEAARILQEIHSTEADIRLLNKEMSDYEFSDDVKELRDRLRARARGDIVLHVDGRYYIISKEMMLELPFGALYFEIIKFAQTFFKVADSVENERRSLSDDKLVERNG